ncbi:helix-turn-helix domain-containing protein [Holdemanella biformis]|uniref:helix-turn-helix domain-containing protein n=1 Tax=Holdemanella biformis TaxID=1735 RepID=UPI00266C3223|nr:helix-turn-helix domain-containing protein [Holdemanella biformis]
MHRISRQLHSDKTGIPKSSISQYMSGYAKPKHDRIYLIAKALHVDEAWLIGYDVPMVKETFTQNLSPNEKNLLDIYRVLDDKGQHTVDTVAQMEYERVKGGSTAILKK